MRVGLIHATTHKDQRTRTERFRVRELRQAGWYSHASETEEEAPAKAEAEQAKGLVFSLSAPLAFRSLPLLALPCKPIPRQASSGNLRADMREAFRITQLASVVTKTLFVQITKQVERFHADIGAVKLALHQAPEVFHSIRMNIAANVLYGVIHDRVLIFAIQPVVRLQRVAEQRRASLDVLANLAVKFMLAAIRYGERANVAAALHHAESDGLILAARSRDDFRAALGVHVARLSADERFVHLNFTREFRSSLVLHRLTDTMIQKPSCRIAASEIALHLLCRNAFLGVCGDRHGQEPLGQGKMALIEYGARGGAVLVAAAFVIALVQATGRNADFLDFALAVFTFTGGFVGDDLGELVGTAGHAPNAIRPLSFQVRQALFFCPELLRGFSQTPCHEMGLPEV